MLIYKDRDIRRRLQQQQQQPSLVPLSGTDYIDQTPP